MPNHCSNRLFIAGSNSDEVARFVRAVTLPPTDSQEDDGRVEYAKDDQFSILHRLFPCPEELNDTDALFGTNDEDKQTAYNERVARNVEKYGFPSWYEWRIHHWGTKWGDYETYLVGEEYTEGDTSVEFGFMSAWAPPVEGIAAISEQFPSLVFILSFDEGGMGFVGATGSMAGVKFADVEGVFPEMRDYDESDEDDQMSAWYELSDAVLAERERCEVEIMRGMAPEYQRLFGFAPSN